MSESDNYEIILKLDRDDPTCYNEEFYKQVEKFEKVRIIIGESRNKVHAINRDIPSDGWDILCGHADDMEWQVRGFDNVIRGEYESGFRGLLHIPEPFAKERLITYPILHRDYYLKDGYVYYPFYDNVACDNEQHEVSVIRGQYKFLPSHGLLIHKHYIAGWGQPDALLEKTENPIGYAKDLRMFHYRKSINFGL